ncbi:MAG: histidine ammonia-lyase [Bacteroidota bacterium]|nr:histidine ammonia-lyase [Bacteroidota bacterium]
MSKFLEIGDVSLTISAISEILETKKHLKLSSDSKKKIRSSRKYLNQKIKLNKEAIYGVNTGFGSLCNHKISDKELEDLQNNLILSHACGTGDTVPQDIIKLMLLLKIQSLSYGYSGVQIETVERLIQMFNSDILPVVYEQGSLGASGDLVPLAHLSLPLLGLGEVYIPGIYENGYYKKRKAKKILKDMGWKPLVLQAKEGLALINGTQFMTAYGVWSLIQSRKLSYFSDLISSISLESFDCNSDAFDNLIQAVRSHKGQSITAKNIQEFLQGSDIQKTKKNYVQDPYSFRCIPQVHGASKDVIDHVKNIFEIEINSVTDNPLVFEKEDKILSGGNFHGQPLAMSLDYLAISLSELGSISERRSFQLISGQRGLPEFLVANPGLNSGMMIPQYTAASIVSQNKQLCTPASIDSIVSSNGQEDHVSMGANAATKLYQITNNLHRILAIEIMIATQALAFRKCKSSDFIEEILDIYRQEVNFLDKDRLLYNDIQNSIDFLTSLYIDEVLL